MCIVFGPFAHLCSAVGGPSELFHQNSLEVASVAELETVEAVQECRHWCDQEVCRGPSAKKYWKYKRFVSWRPGKYLFCSVLEDPEAKKY